MPLDAPLNSKAMGKPWVGGSGLTQIGPSGRRRLLKEVGGRTMEANNMEPHAPRDCGTTGDPILIGGTRNLVSLFNMN